VQTVVAFRQARRRPLTIASESNRQTTILIVRWGLVALSLGLLLTAEGAVANWALGLPAVIALAASNIVLARSQPDVLEGIALNVGIALLDAILVVTAWSASGYESFAGVIVGLGLLNLALAGLNIAELGAIALAAVIFYLAMGQVD
jgi:hypothetical protein